MSDVSEWATIYSFCSTSWSWIKGLFFFPLFHFLCTFLPSFIKLLFPAFFHLPVLTNLSDLKNWFCELASVSYTSELQAHFFILFRDAGAGTLNHPSHMAPSLVLAKGSTLKECWWPAKGKGTCFFQTVCYSCQCHLSSSSSPGRGIWFWFPFFPPTLKHLASLCPSGIPADCPAPFPVLGSSFPKHKF